MKKFNFTYVVPRIVDYRNFYTVEAENKEEAIKKVKKAIKDELGECAIVDGVQYNGCEREEGYGESDPEYLKYTELYMNEDVLICYNPENE